MWAPVYLVRPGRPRRQRVPRTVHSRLITVTGADGGILSPRLPVNVGHYEDTFCKVGDDWAAGPAGHLPSVRERDRPVAAADW
jgi:hypothetical protein